MVVGRKIDIAGLEVNTFTKQELLDQILNRVEGKKQTFLITPYSEFLHQCLIDKQWLLLCQQADFSVADGISLQWATVFLAMPFRSKGYYGKILEGVVQIFITLSWIAVSPRKIRKYIPEKIVGAELIWDLAELASRKKWSVFLLGGFGNTARLVVEKLQQRFPHLNIAGYSDKNPDDISVIDDIRQSGADILFVAYGPFVQEYWIHKNLPQLPVRFAVGLGGTFDYIAGKKTAPPRWIRFAGFEWLYRLFTQPHRWMRIYNATFRLVRSLLRFKVFNSMPYRDNVVAVVVNEKHEVLVCKRKAGYQQYTINGKLHVDYWQFPQGGLDRGEELVTGATRELFEETHIQSATYWFTSHEETSYDWRNGTRRLLFNRLLYRGQKQRIVYFHFQSSSNHEIALDHHELIEHTWVPYRELLNTIHPERFPLGTIVIQDLEKQL